MILSKGCMNNDACVNQASKLRSEFKLKEMIRLISIAKDEIAVCIIESSDIMITSSKCERLKNKSCYHDVVLG